MPAVIQRALHDDPDDPKAVREGLELDVVHANREGDADLLAPLGTELVRFHLLPAVRGGADEIPWLDQVVQMPEVVWVLHAELDLARLRVAVEDTHSPEVIEGDRISAYRDEVKRVNMLSVARTVRTASCPVPQPARTGDSPRCLTC